MKEQEQQIKACDLQKPSDNFSIYERIKNENSIGNFKTFIPHFVRFSYDQMHELTSNGFKVYKGDWDGIIKEAWIIEW